MRQGDIVDGKYSIELELGAGGMGRVFAASHLAIGNTVAIKVLRPEAANSPEVAQRFLREARAAGRLRSDHVVRVTDVGALPTGEPFMVMEMLHGHDLATRIKEGPVPPAEAVDYLVQACEGLAEAHGIGMVHRDIKPANLFVTRRPNGAAHIKVLDFGIATAATGDLDPRLTATQSVMGSPSYMSPEQLKGSRDVDARSDIWSLGVTLYELVTGAQPFTGPTLTALSIAIVTERHPRIANVPPALVAIIDRCLEKQPEHRFANVAELARALSPLHEGGHVAADRVAGSYSQPVAPTLMGLEATIGVSSQVSARRSAVPHGSVAAIAMTSTTSLAAGETGTKMPARSRSWMWLAASAATIAIGIGVGVAIGSGRSGDAPEPAPIGASPPSPAVDPPGGSAAKPDQPTGPIAAPPAAPPVDVPAVDAAPPVDAPPVELTPPKRPIRRPVKPVKPGQPVKPPTPVTDPVPVPVPVPVPIKDPPVKKPCAPNDPSCGL